MFDENVGQLIIIGNKKYIITGDGCVHEKRHCGQFMLHSNCHNNELM